MRFAVIGRHCRSRVAVFLAGALLLCLAEFAWAAAETAKGDGRVFLLSDPSSEVHADFVAGFNDALARRSAGNHLDYAPVDVDASTDLAAVLAGVDSSDLVITVGSAVFERILATGIKRPPKVIAALLPRVTFERLAANLPEAARRDVSAVYIDPPPAKQLQLARELRPEASVVGVLVSADAPSFVAPLRAAARADGIRLAERTAMDDAGLSGAFADLLAEVDISVALPDSLLLNRNNTKWFLYMAFQREVPVIGFSEAFVEAGALASVFSTPGQVGRQAADQAVLWHEKGWDAVRAPVFPRYFSVATNQTVARRLGLALLPQEVLEIRLGTH